MKLTAMHANISASDDQFELGCMCRTGIDGLLITTVWDGIG